MILDHFINAIEHLVLRYGTLGIFFGVFIEEVITIVPSVGVVMSAGFLFLGGHAMDADSFRILLIEIALPASFGLTLGSLFIYSIVYAFGHDVLIRFGKYAHISWKDIEKVQGFMRGHVLVQSMALFLARAIPIIPFSVTNAFCGLVRWSPISYISITFLGAFVRTSLIGFFGWQLGHLYKANILLFRKIEGYLALAIVFFLITYLIYRQLERKKTSFRR